MPSQRQRTRVYFPNVLGIAQHLIQREPENLVCSESLAKPQLKKPVGGGGKQSLGKSSADMGWTHHGWLSKTKEI
jgi:hypothetical protein